MSETAIRVDNIGKQYRIGRRRSRYPTLRDALSQGTSRMVRRAAVAQSDRVGEQDQEDRIWALRDVSFDVARGEVVGIIGANGAGKTTLLRILARVTEPSTGFAEVHGSVGSLLEVGTGFHPELSGRENIYLNGAILGMPRREIERKFDAIVEFAEVERFIETPVKHYSSGMYLRLAFAVAAHLEPEILIVDEVLAVGDAAFQQKCLGKMDRVAREGRTVLFVSHNMDAVRRLCSHCILLGSGRIVARGETYGVIGSYLEQGQDRPGPGVWIDLSGIERDGTGEARFTAARHSSHSASVRDRPYPGGPLDLTLEIFSDASRSVDSVAVSIYTQTGMMLLNADIASRGEALRLEEGENLVRFLIEELHLTPGVYAVGLWLGYAAGGTLDYSPSAFEIEVVPEAVSGFGVTPAANGVVACRFHFSRLEPAS